MSQQKRIILAFAISFIVLLLWQRFVLPPPPPPKTTPTARPAPAGSPVQAAKPAPAPPSPVPLPVQQASQALDIVVESDFYRVTLSNRGAVVKSWILKEYEDEKGQPLDVVNRAACESLGFPFGVDLADPELTKQLNAALFVVAPSGTMLKAPATLEFLFSDGKTQARKKFTFGAGYEIRAEVSVSDRQRYAPVEVAWPGGFGDHSVAPELATMRQRAMYQPAGSSDLTEDQLTASTWSRVGGFFGGSAPPPERKDIPGPLALAGLVDRYFVDVFIPDSPDAKFTLRRQSWTPPNWEGKEEDKPKPLLAMLGIAKPQPLAFRLFVAPKDLRVLRAANPPLDHLVDYGWFSFVAKPLFLGLRYIHGHWTRNYGWAIVILTILITTALFPLKLKQVRSAQEMQRLAPLVKSIQEKYKGLKFNDPRKQRMQQETMKLYQEHKINPLGGCLPVVLQLPFLYGFYKVLDLSIELRHAPWLWWIKDLASPDRLYILPTLMIVSMFMQMKMTPMATADPRQQRMMTIMPLLFGIMFYSFASGLVLYWLTSNLVAIAQQAVINRLMPAPQPLTLPRKVASAKR